MKPLRLDVVLPGIISVAGVGGLMLWWRFRDLWSGPRNEPDSIAEASAARAERPIHFKVSGVDRKSETETSWQITATSEAAAREDAERLGMSVTKVERIGQAH